MNDDEALARRIILALLLVGIILFAIVKTVKATDPPLPQMPNPDVFPCCAGLTPAYPELLQRGLVRWRYSASSSCSGSLFTEVVDALNQISAGKGVLVSYDGNAPMLLYLNCGPAFSAVCGSGAAACLGHGYPYGIQIDLSADITNYFYVTRVSIILHEVMHGLMVWNEQYRLDGTFGPNVGWRDFMNTGPDSRHYWEYVEDQRWARIADPCYRQDCSAGMGVDAGQPREPFIWWRNPPGNVRTALLLCQPDGVGGCASYRWTGLTIPNNGAQFQGWHLNDIPGVRAGDRYCVARESGANVLVGRNDLCL